MTRRSGTLLTSGVLAVVLLFAAVFASVPYVSLGPGPTFDTLGSSGGRPVITISGRETFPTEGHLDLVTVGVRSRLTLGQALLGWFDRSQAVVPRELVFPPGKTDKQVDAENAQQMTASQDAATSAALAQLGIPVQVAVASVAEGSPAQGQLQPDDVLTRVDGTAVTGAAQLRTLVSDRAPGATVTLEYVRGGATRETTLATTSSGETPARAVVGVGTRVVYPFTVDISLMDVGGPSAGLMFALGIIDKLQPGPLNGGRFVAGTGEITPEGGVLPIGGIQQKLVAARDKGATVFLVPAQNCADAASSRPDGLTLAEVGSLPDALEALAAVREGRQPVGC